jgi:PTEN induced putative kinase 1
MSEELQLKNFDIGPPLDKGCNAVVYAANYKTAQPKVASVDGSVDITYEEPVNVLRVTSPQPSTSNLVASISTHGLNDSNSGNAVNSIVKFNETVRVINTERDHQAFSNASAASSSNGEENVIHFQKEDLSIFNYPWALKMMFNYDIQSNAMAILKAMYKETIPARRRKDKENVESWENVIMEQTALLPPHPNIVLMPAFFCDQIPDLKNSHLLYGNALPPRLNPTSGYGRNMSLFLLMKRYNGNLRSYLDENDLDIRTRIIMFAQLLEAIAHINKNKIAHRDLKSGNIDTSR